MFLSTAKAQVFSRVIEIAFCSPVGESVANTPLSQKVSSSSGMNASWWRTSAPTPSDNSFLKMVSQVE